MCDVSHGQVWCVSTLVASVLRESLQEGCTLLDGRALGNLGGWGTEGGKDTVSEASLGCSGRLQRELRPTDGVPPH